MQQRFDVTRLESDLALARHVWSFIVIDDMVVLNYYSREERETRRHKFRPVNAYARLAHVVRSHSDGSQHQALTEDEVPTPQDVLDEALEKARAQLKVGLWRRDFKR